MGKIALFNIPAWGHITPTLPIVKQLVAQGERVHYYITEEYHARVADASGAELRLCPRLVDFPIDSEPSSLGAFGCMLLEQSVAWLPEVLETVRGENYDLILFERTCPWGRFIAEILNIPAIALYTSVFGMLPVPLTSMRPRFLMTELLDWRKHLRLRRAQRELKRRYRLAKLGLVDILTNQVAKNIVFTCREFLPSGNQLDVSYEFVGPCFLDRTGASDFPLDKRDRPLVYISLGTVVDNGPGFFRDCIEAFKNCDISVYMSVGKNVKIAELGVLPENFVVRNFMPQIELLKRAELFITHGGLGSVNESLYYGVPMLIWTEDQQNPERTYNGCCVVRLGAGAILKPNPRPDVLRRKTIAALQNDQFRRSAASLREVFQKSGGIPCAVDVIRRTVA